MSSTKNVGVGTEKFSRERFSVLPETRTRSCQTDASWLGSRNAAVNTDVDPYYGVWRKRRVRGTYPFVSATSRDCQTETVVSQDGETQDRLCCDVPLSPIVRSPSPPIIIRDLQPAESLTSLSSAELDPTSPSPEVLPEVQVTYERVLPQTPTPVSLSEDGVESPVADPEEFFRRFCQKPRARSQSRARSQTRSRSRSRVDDYAERKSRTRPPSPAIHERYSSSSPSTSPSSPSEPTPAKPKKVEVEKRSESLESRVKEKIEPQESQVKSSTEKQESQGKSSTEKQEASRESRETRAENSDTREENGRTLQE